MSDHTLPSSSHQPELPAVSDTSDQAQQVEAQGQRADAAWAEPIRRYSQKHFSFQRFFQSEEAPTTALKFNEHRLDPGMRIVMQLLKISPWICLLLFSSTFGLDILHSFGLVGTFFTQHEAWLRPLNIIAISGLIGYGTNFIAIRMLFRPVVRRPVWGQGLIPSQKDRIIYTLAAGLHKHVLSQELIRRRVEETGLVEKLNNLAMDGTSSLLQDQELRSEVKQWLQTTTIEFSQRADVRQHIREIIDERLEQNLGGGMERLILQTYKRYNKDKYEQAIDKVVAELPNIVDQVVDRFESQLDRAAAYVRRQKGYTAQQIMVMFVDLLDRIEITDLLAKQMAHFDEARLERMIWEATNEQLLYIQYLGTVLGILGGLIIWKSEIMGPVFLLLFGGLYLLDLLLYRWKTKKTEAQS